MKLHEKGFTELAKGSLWIFFGLVTGQILEYINRVLIARFYGPSDYGIVCLGITLAMLASSLSLLGLNVGAARFVAIYSSAKDLFRIKRLIYAGLTIIVPVSLVIAFLMLLFRDFLVVKFFKITLPSGIIIPFILIVPFMAIAEFSYSCLRGLKLAKHAAISREMLTRMVIFLSVVIFISFHTKINGVAFSYLLGFVSYAVLTFFLLRRNVLIRRNGLNGITTTVASNHYNLKVRELVLFSLPLVFAFISTQIGAQLNTIFLGYYRDTTDVGFYSAAIPLAQFINIPLTILLFMFLPVASEHWHDRDIEELKSVFKTVCRWIFIVSCPIFLSLIFFSREIITLTFGGRFSPAHKALIILSIGYFFNGICGPTGALLLATGASKKHFLSVFIGVVAGLFLCLYLIPKSGYIGAAFASMSQLLIINVVYIIFIYQKVKTLPFNLNAFGGLLLAVSLIIVFKNVIFVENFFVQMIVLLGVYLIAIAITKTFKREDISLLSNLFKSTPVKA